ncbi:replication-associated recombination protein A [Oenococcus sicerae]|uniref:Replication-associated recombination protein A n=1 Tax=Oenococcus sicerae TaxID=2203724 RepID=A0AAJ1RDB3_9LACO|nr:replication-associated recombination protein A [Oenococcus sicerae]MDN6900900.1 replication-associated recombination protein A [Oenococcus sicerae]
MNNQPLAYRMRPKKIEDVVGQQQLIGKGKIIWRMVQAHRLSSMILYGAPGTGKTSIASAIAGSTDLSFRILNAATDGKKELQEVAEEGKMSGSVVLLLDEIHRLDKTKQDFLLPHLESGRIILIGATTENPYLSVTPAIRSRTQIFQVELLSEQDIKTAIDRALADKENGLGNYNIKLDQDAQTHLAIATNGDLRSSLNGLELAVLSTKASGKKQQIHITLPIVEETIQRKSMSGDKNGDAHYDVISAFQKSIRGSDADAGIYYLGRILEAGDLAIAARRLLVIAYEDVGLANPNAAAHAVQAVTAALQLGLPEARIPLANAVIELALSPKSNSAYMAINNVMADIEKGGTGDVPIQLKNTRNWGKTKNQQIDYLYPHDFPNDWVAQAYLPNKIKDKRYFQAKGNSKYEQLLFETYNKLKENQQKGLKD